MLVTGPTRAPQVTDRRVVELSDPDVPASRQPYHAGFGTAQTNRAAVERLTAIIERCARRSIRALVRRYVAEGHRLSGVGVVIGSATDPERITSPHIRAHASEGRLFRTVVEKAAARCGLRCHTVVERELPAHAARVLKRPERELKRVVTELGRAVAGPWRAEEKVATLAAWTVLASRRRSVS